MCGTPCDGVSRNSRLTFFFKLSALKITSLHFSTSLLVLKVDEIELAGRELFVTVFEVYPIDCCGEKVATGEPLSSKFGLFRSELYSILFWADKSGELNNPCIVVIDLVRRSSFA